MPECKMISSLNNELVKQKNMFAFAVEQMQEAIFWVDGKGLISMVNNSALDVLGYSGEEITGKSLMELKQNELELTWEELWDTLRKDKRISLEVIFKRKDNSLLEVEVTHHYFQYQQEDYCCCIINNTLRLQEEEQLLKTISEATASLTGMDYLRELTRFITSTLNVRYALISECADEEKTRVRTISYTDRETFLENIEYDLKGTPCELVMQGRDFFCPNELEKQFPKEKGIQSYIAVPITSPATGEVVGHIAALDKVKMKRSQNQLNILRIFAGRAGAEMDRIAALKKLEELNKQLEVSLNHSEERYRDLFEKAPIAYVHERLDSKFIQVNLAAMRILGLKPEEVEETYGKSLVPDTPEAQKRLKDAFDSVGRGTDTSGVVLELCRKDNGQTVFVQWWSNPDPGGEFTRTMFVDITDKVMMEREQERLKAQNQYLREEIKLANNFAEIISTGKSFNKVLQQIEQVASTDATVLIMGESGTGKELIARAVHNISNRNKKPLVKVNCATLPANLIESELFGHERGAFTGAMERKIGRFELADGGTIFLDEIGELPLELQAKFLRVLQEGEFERLGNPRTMKVNVRVVAATNRNLETAIQKKEFREDLYYKLNVFPIICPPLRDRKEDIPMLVNHFCKKYEGRIGKKITAIPDRVMDTLIEYDWPGNIRELENIIERGLILSRDNQLQFGEWLPMNKTAKGDTTPTVSQTLEDAEKSHILTTLQKTNWKVSGENGAAKLLGLNPTTLEAKMKKLGIVRQK